MTKKAFGLLILTFLFHSMAYTHEFKASKPRFVTSKSRLPPDLSCLQLNNPLDLTGYNYYQNVAFDPQIAFNPTNHKNMVIVAQQDALADAVYNSSLPLATIVLYTLDGGETWNQSHLVLSRCQNNTNFKACNNFTSAYFPTVSFDCAGNCYIFVSSYNLFSADHLDLENYSEANIVVKSIDGGINWNQISAVTGDEGICHYLDFPYMTTDPFKKDAIYLVTSDNTCLVRETCTDSNFTGNQNILFQKSTNTGASWSELLTIASFPQDNPNQCTPIPQWHQLAVLPDKHHSLFVTSMIQRSTADSVVTTPYDELYMFKSKDEGVTWKKKVIATIPHVLVVDPDSIAPVLPVTDFTTKDMAINHSTGYIYVVYSDPQFNPTGQAGCVIKMSKNGGKNWSKPRPINPDSLDVQTFLPTVAVAKDGTVGVLFYDFRKHKSGKPALNTDVWMAFFDKDLKTHLGEVRLTHESFDTRQSIRGYNGVDPQNCQFDYYLSNHVGLQAINNDFVAAFTVTQNGCEVATIGTFPCDSFPMTIDDCSRQNIVFAKIKRN
ncbi:MAG: glycoside hydrolase [Chlamydiales bacterium]|nr:glycoside hydrolase [Chlamydiales bacterium]